MSAVNVAIELLRVPSQVRRVRSLPLPDGVFELLRIAAADTAAVRHAAEMTGRSPAFVREAAAFFIEQVLLSPDADCYRVLGTAPNATDAELRRNMVLLLKGLHPDVHNGVRSLFAHRVTEAWDTLKTPERRTAYDDELKKRARSKKKTVRPRVRHHRAALKRGGRGATLPRELEALLRRILRALWTGVRA